MSNVIDMKKVAVLEKVNRIINVACNMNKRQRKLYNEFLYMAQKTLKKDPFERIFYISLLSLKNTLDLSTKDKNNAILKEKILKFLDIKLEYNILNKYENVNGHVVALYDIEFKTNNKTKETVVKYSIPEIVREAFLKKSGIYENIDLMVIKGLRSKYSIILYELAKDYKEAEVLTMEVKKFRRIFGVENKYDRIYNLKKIALNPACGELNENQNVPFLVNYKLIKQGNVYTYIKFTIKQKHRQIQEQQYSSDESDKQKVFSLLLRI